MHMRSTASIFLVLCAIGTSAVDPIRGSLRAVARSRSNSPHTWTSREAEPRELGSADDPCGPRAYLEDKTCVCRDPFVDVLIGSYTHSCECPTGLVAVDDTDCVCEDENASPDDTGACACNDGYVVRDADTGTCVLDCADNEVWHEDSQTCQCADGYQPKEPQYNPYEALLDGCVEDCPAHEVLDYETGECVCTGDYQLDDSGACVGICPEYATWSAVLETCVCPVGYEMTDDKCVLIDTDATSLAEDCPSGYHLNSDGTCVKSSSNNKDSDGGLGAGAIVGIVFACLAFVGGVAAIIFKKRGGFRYAKLDVVAGLPTELDAAASKVSTVVGSLLN